MRGPCCVRVRGSIPGRWGSAMRVTGSHLELGVTVKGVRAPSQGLGVTAQGLTAQGRVVSALVLRANPQGRSNTAQDGD